jgi:hypothetical protein
MNPMTTDEAYDKYGCRNCTEVDFNEECCETFCVESRTCSLRCPRCRGRNWFPGDLHKAPVEFACRYCGEIVVNRIASHYAKLKSTS